ncbi:hypothetical protein TWF730_010245 [Orbilia blumenaviensis]|uniref:Uncharacterized protein n=1 Tax=Orbilia blumenaviensis TaxID=1796055 RepID=A0AAV9URK9_9PEZI
MNPPNTLKGADPMNETNMKTSSSGLKTQPPSQKPKNEPAHAAERGASMRSIITDHKEGTGEVDNDQSSFSKQWDEILAELEINNKKMAKVAKTLRRNNRKLSERIAFAHKSLILEAGARGEMEGKGEKEASIEADWEEL